MTTQEKRGRSHIEDESESTLDSRKRPRIDSDDIHTLPTNHINSAHSFVDGHSNTRVLQDAGQIEYIRLENFMCHRNLEVRFTSGVNVVTGNNGSGKSAILAGLQVALGSKAKSTNRGTSMKEVIKEGEDSCRVTVHLSNQGPDAFDPETYGSRIIVMRRLSKNTSSYKIQNADGHAISTSVKDLRIILDHFNIHLDNPCTVMNQDVSRLFLANETPSSKYRFFLEATQLQKMIDDFEDAIKHKNIMERAIEQKQEALKDSQRELDRLKKEFEDASHLKDLDRQILKLDDEILWAVVRDRETLLKRFQDKYDELKKDFEEKKQQKSNLEQERLETEGKIETLKRELSEKTNLFKIIDTSLLEDTEEYSKVKKDSGVIQRNIDDWESRIRQSKQRVKAYTAELSKLEEASQDNRSNVEREKKLQSLEEAIIDYENQLEANRKSQDLKTDELAVAETAIQDAGKLLSIHEDRLKKVQTKMDQIRRRNKDPLSYFSPEIHQLIKEISENKRSFKKVPIGPIGLMVKVKEVSWAGSVELALKAVLSSFIVDNSEDRQRLMSMAKKNGARISAITQTFKSEVYSSRQLHRGGIPDSSFTTILDIIAPNESQAQMTGIQYGPEGYATTVNVLIDQANIAQTIVARTDEEAKQIMFSREHPPANTLICFSMNGSKFQKKGTTEVVDPRKSVISILWADDQQISVEMEAEKKSRLEEVQQRKEELKKIEKHLRSIKSQLSSLRDEEQKLVKLIRHSHQSLDKLKQEVSIDPADKYKDDISFKRNQIEEEIQKQASWQENIDKCKQENEEVITKTKEIALRITELKEKKNIIKVEMNAMTQQIENAKNHCQVIESNILTLDRGILAQERSIALLESNVTEKLEEVKESIRLASEVCPERLYPTLSTEDIKNKRSALNHTREQEQERFGGRSVAQIESAYLEFLRAYTHAKESIESAVEDLSTFERSLNMRYNKWTNLRKYYVKITNHWFNTYLSQKGHSGKLEFDLEADTLETVVYFSTADGKMNEIRDAKSLSGGERSFTTTMFLLALWKAVESPFRCLDEFDVFMDAIYRKKAFDMLMSEALKSNTKQLIIITPLNVSMLKGDVNIIRLKPPARDGLQQTSLHDFSIA